MSGSRPPPTIASSSSSDTARRRRPRSPPLMYQMYDYGAPKSATTPLPKFERSPKTPKSKSASASTVSMSTASSPTTRSETSTISNLSRRGSSSISFLFNSLKGLRSRGRSATVPSSVPGPSCPPEDCTTVTTPTPKANIRNSTNSSVRNIASSSHVEQPSNKTKLGHYYTVSSLDSRRSNLTERSKSPAIFSFPDFDPSMPTPSGSLKPLRRRSMDHELELPHDAPLKLSVDPPIKKSPKIKLPRRPSTRGGGELEVRRESTTGEWNEMDMQLAIEKLRRLK